VNGNAGNVGVRSALGRFELITVNWFGVMVITRP